MHLNKSGSGFTSRTACGRNILRTPMSTDWANFKMESSAYRCIKCVASKQFEVNTKMDVRKMTDSQLIEQAHKQVQALTTALGSI